MQFIDANRVTPLYVVVEAESVISFASSQSGCAIVYPFSAVWSIASTVKVSLNTTNVSFGFASFPSSTTVVNTNSVLNISRGSCAGQYVGSGAATFICTATIPAGSTVNCTGTGSTGFTFSPSSSVGGSVIVSSGCQLNGESVAASSSSGDFELNDGTICRGATFRGVSCALRSGVIIGPTTAMWLDCITITGPPTGSALSLSGTTTGSITI